MLAATAVSPSPAATGIELEPKAASELLARGEAVLVDVREPDEHARERIQGARLLPLGKVTPASIAALGSGRVLIHCKSGRRGSDATARCASLASSGIVVQNVRGGIEAWRGAGLPTVVDADRPRLGIMQQTQVTVGVAALAGTALGAFVSPWFLALPGVAGMGLVYAGLTGRCGLSNLLALAPWNRSAAGCARCGVR